MPESTETNPTVGETLQRSYDVIADAVQAGDRVRARDVYGHWHPAVADSAVEGIYSGRRKIHDFPVIWVIFDGKDDRVPWPIEDVQKVTP